jgi:hypothetical protein
VAIAGFTRFRKHQWGLQTTFGTAVAADRVMPWRGAIEINPNRELPDVDVGSLDPILAPLEGAKEITASLEGPLTFNDLTYVYSAGLKGGETGTGPTAFTWTYDPASLTADTFDYYTDEWGDDTSASDGIKAFDGVLDSWSIGFGDDLGVFNFSGDMVYGGATMATDRTAGLTVDSSPIFLYGADTEVYLNSTSGAIGTTKLTDAIHGAELSVQNNLDQKRFANGSNTRFNLAGFGRGERVIELQLTVAKTTATMAERATLDDSPVPNRYLEVKTTSPTIITGSTPYSNRIRMPGRLISATDGEIGGNTTITFTYRAFYDSTLTYALNAVLVNTLSAL